MSLAGTGYFDVEASTPVICAAIEWVIGPVGTEYATEQRRSQSEVICKSILKSRHTYVQKVLTKQRKYTGPPHGAPKLNIQYPSPGQQKYVDNYVLKFGTNADHAIPVNSGDDEDDDEDGTEHKPVVAKVKEEPKQDSDSSSSSQDIRKLKVDELFASSHDSTTEEEPTRVGQFFVA